MQQFFWQIFNAQIKTVMKMKEIKYSDGKCKIWKTEGENLEHLLYQSRKMTKSKKKPTPILIK